jgi:hypothetical protein
MKPILHASWPVRLGLLILVMTVAPRLCAQFERVQYFDGADTIPGQSLILNMDTSAANIWQVGPPQKVIFHSAATPPNALLTDTAAPYPVNNMSRFSFKAVPWVTWGILAVQWMQKIDMDGGHDGGIIEYSVDTGSTWTNVFNDPHVYSFYGFPPEDQDTLLTGEYAFSGTDTTWRDVWLCFDMSWLSFNDSIYFRFIFKSDSIDGGKEGWMIDNMTTHISMMHPVKENEKKDYMNVYPNPAKDIVYIEFEKVHQFHLIEDMKLVGPDGKLVRQWRDLPTKYWFDVRHFPEGMYFLTVRTNIRTETIPLLIKRP